MDIAAIRQAQDQLAGVTVETPVLPLSTARWQDLMPEGASVAVKLELFQQAGSFKARGAWLGIAGLSAQQRGAGVVAASGGNHALAVSWAAQAAGVSAHIAMPRATDPVRIAGCKALGADVSLHDDIAGAFAEMETRAAGGAILMHPFEAPHMLLGSATCGAEMVVQLPDLDAVVIPVGGGGLIAGMSRAIKLMSPGTRVIGVEPVGADSMTRSLAAGAPVTLDRVDTIADSLGAPKALPLSFKTAQASVDQMVHVTDDALRQGMRHYRDKLQLLAEPACAAALAAVTGPLRAELAGQRVGILACGSNIGLPRFTALTETR